MPLHNLNPLAEKAALEAAFVGQHLQSIPSPAAVLDAAVIRRNCSLMLDTARQLGVGFRAHVKTHKTIEVSKLSVGEERLPVKLVASTVAEIEFLTPWLRECVDSRREVNILYGLPIVPSAVPRLAAVAKTLGAGSIGVFVDHVEHVRLLDRTAKSAGWPGAVPVFVNIDTGDHREGVTTSSKQLGEIAIALSESSSTRLEGFYAHMGSSYGGSSPDEALRYLCAELRGVAEGANTFAAKAQKTASDGTAKKLTLSVGATPSATAAQNVTEGVANGEEFLTLLDKLKQDFSLELHAGVNSLLDLQQLATRNRPAHASGMGGARTLLSHSDLAFRILTEVASLYSDRADHPEALVASGSIALGREPCKAYSGWGVVSPWPESSENKYYDFEGSRTGWIVGRISQEHGILTWEGAQDRVRQLELGEKLLIWPNHACIASANFSWYVVVDSDTSDANIVREVWLRCRGW